jgi:hypothetical protein
MLYHVCDCFLFTLTKTTFKTATFYVAANNFKGTVRPDLIGLAAVCHSFCIYLSLYNTVDTFIQSYIPHS